MIAPEQESPEGARGHVPGAPLAIALEERGGTAVVAFDGEIDIGEGERVAGALAEAVAAARRSAVADLRGVTFLGSTGVRLLLEARALAAGRGVGFALLLGDGPARRAIELLGIDERIDIVDRPDTAREGAVHIDPAALASSVEGLASVASEPIPLEDALERVIQAAKRLFAVSGAGLMMVDGDGALRYVVATDPATHALESVQEELGEGPCVDSFVLGTEVRTDDLGADPRYDRLGPRLAPEGIHAVLGVPTRVSGTPIGSLNVYRDAAYSWDDSDVAAIVAYNGVVESLLVSAVAARKSGELARQLQEALERRIVIERAVGVLMGRHDLDPVTAFNALRRAARNERRKVGDLAADVLGGAAVALSGRGRS